MKTNKLAVPRTQSSPKNRSRSTLSMAPRCQFSTSDGRRCAMLRHDSHSSFCLFHTRQEQQLLDLDRIGAELVSLSGEFKTASDLNHVLGKLFQLVAENCIPPRNATTLAYIGQLLLHSLHKVHHEIKTVQGVDAWTQILLRSLPPQP